MKIKQVRNFILAVFITVSGTQFELLAQDTGNTMDRTIETAAMVHEPASLQFALANYLKGLNHSNTGLIESSIVNILNFKFHYPDKDYGKIKERLHELETAGPTQGIQFMATIASNYLNNPEKFSWMENAHFTLKPAYLTLQASESKIHK